jgi:hypothetical protein
MLEDYHELGDYHENCLNDALKELSKDKNEKKEMNFRRRAIRAYKEHPIVFSSFFLLSAVGILSLVLMTIYSSEFKNYKIILHPRVLPLVQNLLSNQNNNFF